MIFHILHYFLLGLEVLKYGPLDDDVKAGNHQDNHKVEVDAALFSFVVLWLHVWKLTLLESLEFALKGQKHAVVAPFKDLSKHND
jgi:hypothetical protein